MATVNDDLQNDYEDSYDQLIDDDDLNEEDQPSSLKRGFSAWMISLLIHAAILLFAAIFIIMATMEEEKVPIAHQPMTEQVQIKEDPMEEMKEIEVDVEVTMEAVQAAVTADVVSELVMDTESLAESNIAISDSASFMAIGAGASGGGMNGSGGAFMMGGGGGGGGGKGFFGAKSGVKNAHRTMFIIDMSASLKTPQVEVLKRRLIGTLGDLTPRDSFEIAFFSGPTWLIDHDANEIRAGWTKGASHHDYAHNGNLPEGKWRRYSKKLMTEVTQYITDLQKTVGTDWRHPFDIAYSMYPQPQVIFFLTDGKVNNSEETIKMVKLHPQIPVITIGYGLDDQDGIAALKEMSELTKGSHVALSMQEINDLYAEIQAEEAGQAK